MGVHLTISISKPPFACLTTPPRERGATSFCHQVSWPDQDPWNDTPRQRFACRWINEESYDIESVLHVTGGTRMGQRERLRHVILFLEKFMK